ncbi:chymotrypsin inhibitor-like protein [Aphelenchoides avenae]|nr:chymotrypsin inhibitor-like protein [Aphelenchus avenae]
MQRGIVYALTVFVIVCLGAVNSTECGDHEHYSDCGTACEPKCYGKHIRVPEMCTMQCVQGCFCDDGYARDSKGRCVACAP